MNIAWWPFGYRQMYLQREWWLLDLINRIGLEWTDTLGLKCCDVIQNVWPLRHTVRHPMNSCLLSARTIDTDRLAPWKIYFDFTMFRAALTGGTEAACASSVRVHSFGLHEIIKSSSLRVRSGAELRGKPPLSFPVVREVGHAGDPASGTSLPLHCVSIIYWRWRCPGIQWGPWERTGRMGQWGVLHQEWRHSSRLKTLESR